MDTDYKKLIEAATEKKADKECKKFRDSSGAIYQKGEDRYLVREGASLPNDLLLKAIECLDRNEVLGTGFTNMDIKKTLEEIKQALMGAGK